MESDQNQVSIKSFLRSQIKAINNKRAATEKIVEEHFLGRNFTQTHPLTDFLTLDSKQKKQLVHSKEKLKNGICYYLIGKQTTIRWDDAPRDWLEEIWHIYASCQKKELENHLYKQSWDLEHSRKFAFDAFQHDKTVSDLLNANYSAEIPNSKLLERITDTDLRSVVSKHIILKPAKPKKDLPEELKIYNHNFIYEHGIFDTPQALVERTILLRAALILNGINPYGKREISQEVQEQYAYLNPIKATIFELNILATKFRKTLIAYAKGVDSAYPYWKTSSLEYKFYSECVIQGIDSFINKLENFSRLKNYTPGATNEFTQPISLKVLASLRDVTSIRMSLELGESKQSREFLNLPPKGMVKKALKRKGKQKEVLKDFDFMDVKNYLENHPKTSKILRPLEMKHLAVEQRDLIITDILS